jgi:hypothetical protein
MHLDRGETVGARVEMSRSVVIAWISGGYTVATIYRGQDGNWHKGADVMVVTREGEPYIRTDSDNKREDNLGELPRF